MKVFISHQQADSRLALQLSTRLKNAHQMDSYLDVIDPSLAKTGDALADHVKEELGKCSQLLAVVSEATRASWWVPWEIGIATEKNYPLATFSAGLTPPPEYLRKWPYLRSEADLDLYASASKIAFREFSTKRTYLSEEVAQLRSTKEFHRSLRASLGQ